MDNHTDYQQSIAEEIAVNPTYSTVTKSKHHLATEAKRLEKAITVQLTSIENYAQRDTFHFITPQVTV